VRRPYRVSAFEKTSSKQLSADTTSGLINPFDEVSGRVVVASHGKHELAPIWRNWRVGADRLVDHQVASACAHRRLEPLDGIENPDELCVALIPRELHAGAPQACGDIVRDISALCISAARLLATTEVGIGTRCHGLTMFVF
jgi:hypothetical protein